MDNGELIDLATDGLTGEILHTAEIDGTVAVVTQHNGERRYHAREFTQDGEEGWTEAGGYSTTERHWYMGDRYKNPELWGIFFSEVFWTDGVTVASNRRHLDQPVAGVRHPVEP